MASRYPFFWREPIRYCRWAANEKPAIFYSLVICGFAPLSFFYAPPLRRLFKDTVDPAPIPLTYPIPKGPRNIPKGYDD